MDVKQGATFPLFCNLCGAMLPIGKAHEMVTCYNCSSRWTIPEIHQLTWSYSETFNDASANSRATSEPASSDGVLVERLCSKCGAKKMSYSTWQTRSADEGMTVFFTCIKCGHREIEYS